MGDDARPWAIDRSLARDLADALGWAAGDGVAALSARMPAVVPMGSTAKLAAIAAGEVPPGDEPAGLARRLLDHAEALRSAPPGGAPSPSWSCWVASTVMAALVDAAGQGRVHVAATRRIDAGAPLVDFHAAVVVDGPAGVWICDPYFGVAALLPEHVGSEEVAVGPTGTATARRLADAGWHYDLDLDVWDTVLRFRCFGPALDRGDVRAMAALSVTHTGVPLRPYARLHPGEGIVDASESAAGVGVLHSWRPGAARQEETVATWADAVERFAVQTGTRIT